MTDCLSRLLAARPYLVADGAMGTNLFQRGLATGDSPELWNVDRPDQVAAVHRDFAEAGSDIVLTNSFGGSRHRLKLHGADARARELNRAAARIAREVADAAGRQVLVAGSIGPTGELFEPLGLLTMDEAVDSFAEQAAGLAEGGADLLWIETMSAEAEVSAALQGAGRTGLPLVCTMTFDTNERSMMGVTPADFVRFCTSATPRPAAFGANCGVGPAELIHSILGMTEEGLTPFRPEGGPIIVAKGNCGIPQYQDGRIVYDGTPELMADYARLARAAGARIIGGCCGSTAAHVRAIVAALKDCESAARPDLATVADKLGAPWARLAPAKAESESPTGERGGRRRRRG
jgi:5-methyltetrahydrofolate--homocysteine methyltransferase